MPRQRPLRRQTPLRPHPQRIPLARDRADRGGARRDPREPGGMSPSVARRLQPPAKRRERRRRAYAYAWAIAEVGLASIQGELTSRQCRSRWARRAVPPDRARL